MRRLFLFLGALGWMARLQMLVIAIILGCWIRFDIRLQVWPVTIVIIVVSWVIGRLLLPFMLARPLFTYRVLNSLGFVLLALYSLSKRQAWRNKLDAHFGWEFALWLNLSCAYWFFSEVRLQAERRDKELSEEQSNSRFEDDRDHTSERIDENVYAWRGNSDQASK